METGDLLKSGFIHDRIRNETAPYVNRRIDRYTEGSIAYYSQQNRDEVIARIAELDKEWDLDRALMLIFSIAGGSTFAAGMKVNRNWLYLFGVQLAFLAFHAIKGWCPPASVLRRMGFRTRLEIDFEKQMLMRMLEESEKKKSVH
jgi:hypothetical protein